MSPTELARERESADDALVRLEQGSDFPRIDADEVRRMFDAYEREIKALREAQR